MAYLDYSKKIDNILLKDKRYRKEAYNFVLNALNHTISKLPKPRHITGRELLEGIKDFGISQFGPMVFEVFEHWGIETTDDFGEIVFNLIEQGLLSKTETDSKDDFKDVFDLKDTFKKEFKFIL
ncbi:MAG: hypothetical protein FJZ16_00300 [Candidatus Omnitrophica bacterium]|nr:hypothetical protein [Candidatus Omnitrophota bacterium]